MEPLYSTPLNDFWTCPLKMRSPLYWSKEYIEMFHYSTEWWIWGLFSIYGGSLCVVSNCLFKGGHFKWNSFEESCYQCWEPVNLLRVIDIAPMRPLFKGGINSGRNFFLLEVSIIMLTHWLPPSTLTSCLLPWKWFDSQHHVDAIDIISTCGVHISSNC